MEEKYELPNKLQFTRWFCDICHMKIGPALGYCRPLKDAKESGNYPGVYVAEQVLSKYFKNITRMKFGNVGYDYVCERGYKIDVKLSCLHKQESGNKFWSFRIKKNTISDFFLCLAFDNRTDLNPRYLWLIPGNIINNKIMRDDE